MFSGLKLRVDRCNGLEESRLIKWPKIHRASGIEADTIAQITSKVRCYYSCAIFIIIPHQVPKVLCFHTATYNRRKLLHLVQRISEDIVDQA
jgi:hypothetical protein